MNKLLAILAVGVMVFLAVVIISGYFLYTREDQPSVVAIGLRGDSEVSKTLTKTQREKMEKHLTTMPTMPAVHEARLPQQPSDVVDDIQKINRFNQSQNK